MPPKKKKAAKKTRFLVEHRMAMITDLEKDDHAEIVHRLYSRGTGLETLIT